MSFFALTDHEVYLLTTRDDERGRDNAMIVTWVVPATLVAQKPRLVALISTQNYSYELLRRSGRFAVQLLAAGQHDLLERCGLHSGRDGDKLAGLTLGRTGDGLPLVEGSCGWAACQVCAELDLGDRVVVVANVVEQQIVDSSRATLRKRAALAQLPGAVVAALIEKQLRDGLRDLSLWRELPDRSVGM